MSCNIGCARCLKVSCPVCGQSGARINHHPVTRRLEKRSFRYLESLIDGKKTNEINDSTNDLYVVRIVTDGKRVALPDEFKPKKSPDCCAHIRTFTESS
ncbi:hypothetical protein ACOME3_005849 [Neoechinorhynchus agilis]